MAHELKVGDRVVLASSPTFQGSWGPDFIGPKEGIGGLGEVVGIDGDCIAVLWGNATSSHADSGLMDASCLQFRGLDLPPSLRREEVESWLDSP